MMILWPDAGRWPIPALAAGSGWAWRCAGKMTLSAALEVLVARILHRIASGTDDSCKSLFSAPARLHLSVACLLWGRGAMYGWRLGEGLHEYSSRLWMPVY